MQWKLQAKKDIIKEGIDTVIWYWNDDKGKLHTNKFNNEIYFTESPVNILSATAVTESMNFDQGTWVLKIKYSNFTWYFGKYIKTISHSENWLLLLEINLALASLTDFSREWY